VAALPWAHLPLPQPVGDQVDDKNPRAARRDYQIRHFVSQTAFRCELKDALTGKVTIVNVPLKFDIAPSGTAEAEADHMVAAMSSNVGRGVRASTGDVVPIHSNNAARAASAKYAKKVEEGLDLVKAAIQDHTATHIFSIFAMLYSTDGCGSTIFAFSTHTPCSLT
jgi:hypothetical protein